MDHAAASDDIVYAGFWRRLGAYVIDNFILTVAFYVAVILVGLIVYGAGIAKPETRDAGQWFIISLLPLYYVGAALYYGLQESSRHQATVGKRALGIKVTDAHGRRLTRGRAFGRWFAAALSYLTVYIGFIMAAFTGRKQALHDMVAETLVVDRWAYTEFPERQQRHVGALAVILSLVLLVVPIIAILAAIAIPAYQEYMLRAQTAEAMAAAAPVKALVARAWGEHHACPDNGEAGIAPAKLYASGHVAGIKVGKMHDSRACGIEITLASPSKPLDGQRIWLEFDGTGGAWTCSSEIDRKYLPKDCRD